MGEGNRDEVFFLGRLGTTPLSQLTDRLKLYAFFSSRLKYDNRGKGILDFKGRVHIFFIRELDVPPLGESNLMGPKKSVEVKFFKVAFFGVCRASSNGARRHH